MIYPVEDVTSHEPAWFKTIPAEQNSSRAMANAFKVLFVPVLFGFPMPKTIETTRNGRTVICMILTKAMAKGRKT